MHAIGLAPFRLLTMSGGKDDEASPRPHLSNCYHAHQLLSLQVQPHELVWCSYDVFLPLKSQPLNAKRGDRGSRAEVQDAGAQGPLVDPFRCCMPPCLRTAFCDPPATAPLLRLRLSPRSRECEQGRAREGRAKSERSREGRAETERSRESEQRRAREGQARARGRARGREGERAREQIHP